AGAGVRMRPSWLPLSPLLEVHGIAAASFEPREGLTMKALAITALTLALALGIAAGAVAQTTTPPPGGTTTQPGASTPPPASAPSAQTPSTPGTPQTTAPGTSSSDSSKDVNVTTRTERRDAGDASPRTSADSRRVFGLNPTAAAIIAAALLVVVILAIVSMSRGASRADTHVDVDRRL